MSRPARHRRARSCALVAGLLLALADCGRDGGGAKVTDPASRLSRLLREGALPGELTVAERGEAERLLLPVLPKLDGALAGYRWRVAYDDLPDGDFMSVDLMQGEGEAAPRAMWFHLFWRGALPAAEQGAYLLRLGPWPARGIEGHHLFVRLGDVELRAVAEAPEFRDAQRIREVLGRFDLAALARL
ncbi:MAG TPA: hypothetical protein VGV61_18115 [Thermoanaerobaculia bacterium]|jgi:hypothetical protein|nr:hypothetical protein [Thermoanaerobaculia bacterium]